MTGKAYNPDQPRAPDGEWGAGGGGKAPGAKQPRKVDTRVTIEKRETGPKDLAKSERAKQAYDAKRSSKDVQDYAEKAEAEVVRRLGGVQGGDNGAVDVVRRLGGIEHGLEVKCITNKGGPNKSGSDAQIKCEPDQKTRKNAWVAAADNRRSGVVVLDHRDRAATPDGRFIGNKEAYSGHELYYRRDYGEHTLGGMYKASGASEVLSLMGKSDDQLRAMMAADPKKYKGVIRKPAKS